MVVEDEEGHLNFSHLTDGNSYTNLLYIQVLNVFFKVLDEIGISDS